MHNDDNYIIFDYFFHRVIYNRIEDDATEKIEK